MAKINYSPKSLLGFLTAISFIGWLSGAGLNMPQISRISMPVFLVCFGIWLIFVFLSIGRNVRRF